MEPFFLVGCHSRSPNLQNWKLSGSGPWALATGTAHHHGPAQPPGPQSPGPAGAWDRGPSSGLGSCLKQDVFARGIHASYSRPLSQEVELEGFVPLEPF